MHFHLPKPLHGWREFAGEVAIIVLGITIALGAEQVVQSIHASNQAKQAESRVRSELIDDSALEVERIAIDNCLRQRLGGLANGLATGKSDWSSLVLPESPGMPTALREIYHMPSRNWVTDAYREALAQGEFESLPPDRRASYAELYKQMDKLADLNDEEQRVATQLAPLQFDLSLERQERGGMLAAIARLDELNKLIVLVSRQNLETVHDLGFKVTRRGVLQSQSKEVWADLLNNSPNLRARYGNCVNINAAAQFDPALANPSP